MKKIILFTLLPLASIAQTAQDTFVANLDSTLQIAQDLLQNVPTEWNTGNIIAFGIAAIVAIVAAIGVWKKKKSA